MSRNDYYRTGNIFDYPYHQNYYKITGNDLIGIDLSGQTNTSIPQHINFTGKLEEDHGSRSLFLLKSCKKLF